MTKKDLTVYIEEKILECNEDLKSNRDNLENYSFDEYSGVCKQDVIDAINFVTGMRYAYQEIKDLL